MDAGPVVVATSFPWPKPGGLERVVELEVKELQRRGADVRVLCARSDHDPEGTVPGVPVERAPYRYYSFLPGFLGSLHYVAWAAPRLRRRLRGGGVVHAHNTYAALAAVLAGLGRRTALHLHSVSSEDAKLMEASDLPLAARLLNRIDAAANLLVEMWTYNRVAAVLPVSEYERDDAVRKSRRPERVRLVRNGVDTGWFRPDAALREKTRRRLGLGGDEPLVAFVGRFVPKNGTLVLARAVVEARRRGLRARWVFAGTGSEEAEMRRILGDAPDVLFLPPQESAPLYAMADVFVSHVSTAVEGHGLTVIEAMASGVPTVTGVDRIKAPLFEDGVDLLFVPKDDPAAVAEAVRRILEDPVLAKRLAEGGRARVERDFSVRAQVDAVLASLRAA